MKHSSTTPVNLRKFGFNKTADCVNATCDGSPAQRFTFGLNFTNQDEHFTSASVRVELVHPRFPLRPLTWRSSKKYPVKELNHEDEDLSKCSIPSATSAILKFVVVPLFVAVICALTSAYCKRRTSKADYSAKQTPDLLEGVPTRSSSRCGDEDGINTSKGPTQPTPQVLEKSAIPKTIQNYEMYREIKNGRFIWICNFDDAQNKIAKDLLEGEENIKDLFVGKEPHKMKYKPYIRSKEKKKKKRTTCNRLLKTELSKHTDCFICIISSYSNDTHIYNKESFESISTLAGIDNSTIIRTLRDMPKILIFDLHETYSKSKDDRNPSPMFKLHKDWLIVIARNRRDGSFISKLKSEIKDKSDKLDFVSILECVKRAGFDMKILHRMPRKLFLGERRLQLDTASLSHYVIDGAVRCCFFGCSEFVQTELNLPGIDKDRELLRGIFSNQTFEFKECALKNSKKTVKHFRKELKKNDGCLFFVFSSHGNSEGVLTFDGSTVHYDSLVEEIAKTRSKIPICIAFDCCRTDGNIEQGNNVSITRRRLKMKNVIVVYAAIEGHTAHMTTDDTASVFINTMCEVIREQRLDSDFVTMMECVNQRICESNDMDQTCVEIDSQLTKKLFLFETKTEREG